jgi:hypothetical protein
MMNIESKLWKVTASGDGYADITYKPSGVTRTVLRNVIPADMRLQMAHELTFNRWLSEAFNSAD